MTVTFTEKYSNIVNRQGWDSGPWDGEMDKAVWVHNGYDCMIKRNDSGAWCGYVGVKKGHPLFGVNYFKIYTGSTDINGGLTYSDECQGDICHLADDGDHVWWLGFDCCHGFNYYPGGISLFMDESSDNVHSYVTQEQVIRMVNNMAEKVDTWETWDDDEESSEE